MRVGVGVGGVLVALLAVLVGRGGVLLRLFVLAMLVVVGGLEVVVGGGLVAGGRLVVVLGGRVRVLGGHDFRLPKLVKRRTSAGDACFGVSQSKCRECQISEASRASRPETTRQPYRKNPLTLELRGINGIPQAIS